MVPLYSDQGSASSNGSFIAPSGMLPLTSGACDTVCVVMKYVEKGVGPEG